MGRGGRGENKGAFPEPPHKPLCCPAWHKWKLRCLIFDLPSSVKLPQSQRICQMWGMCYTFNKKYYWYFYFCVIHGTLKSCNFPLWQISLTKLSLLALMTFVRHRRQQISLTARYSLDIHSVQNNQDEECVLPASSTTKLFQFNVSLKAIWGSNYSV